ncbi:MAG: hypothetical protein LBQ66_01185, partial [Planctomycetaceae bacterium]|nr:hypothetical protein [Planctomycetaceae bacterium]
MSSRNLLTKIVGVFGSLLDWISESSSDTIRRRDGKRRLSFETLESRELLSANPYLIDETGTFYVERTGASAEYANSLSAYLVDDVNGTIDGVNPSDAGYLAKAQSRVIGSSISNNTSTDATVSFSLTEDNIGQYLAFFDVCQPPSGATASYFFIFDAANPSGFANFIGEIGSGSLRLEDRPHFDNDYDDLIVATYLIPKDITSSGTECDNTNTDNNNGDNTNSQCCGSASCAADCSCSAFGNLQFDTSSGNLNIDFGGVFYNSSNNPSRVILSDFQLPSTGDLPERIIVTLTFANLAPITVYYSTSNLSNDDIASFGIQVDVSTLASGRYEWYLDIESVFSDGSSTLTQRDGYQDVVNWLDSSAGRAWNLPNLDRIQVVGNDGVNWLQGNGNSIWFKDNNDGTYTVENGSQIGATLANVNGIFIVTEKNGTKYSFNSAGFLATKTDATGNQTAYTYDSQNRLSTVTTPDGHTTTYQYNSAGLLINKIDFANRVTTYSYDSSNRLISITNPDPDGSGQLLPAVTTFGYLNATSLISQITDANGNVTTFTYDDTGTITTVTRGNNIETLQPYGNAVIVDLSQAGYDYDHPADLQHESAKLGQQTDANNNTFWFTLDTFGNLTYKKDADGYEINYIRDADSNIVKTIERHVTNSGLVLVRTTDYSYDSVGNLTQIKYHDGSTETWTYDPIFNKVTSYTDQLGRQTIYEIDPNNGLVLSVRQVVGNIDSQLNGENDDVVTSYVYTTAPLLPNDPPAGLVKTITDALGIVTSFDYNMCGHVVTIVEAFGTSSAVTFHFEYDSFCRQSASIDPLGRRTEYLYDNVNNLVKVILPAETSETPLEINYAYDALGQVIQVTDPNGATINYTYNQDGNILSETFNDPEGVYPPNLTLFTYSYDNAGNLIFQYDSVGRYTGFVYDSMNRVRAVKSGDQNKNVTDLQIQYDGFGRVIREQNAVGEAYSYKYDIFDRLIEIKR